MKFDSFKFREYNLYKELYHERFERPEKDGVVWTDEFITKNDILFLIHIGMIYINEKGMVKWNKKGWKLSICSKLKKLCKKKLLYFVDNVLYIKLKKYR